jgi:hypothetical protein
MPQDNLPPTSTPLQDPPIGNDPMQPTDSSSLQTSTTNSDPTTPANLSSNSSFPPNTVSNAPTETIDVSVENSNPISTSDTTFNQATTSSVISDNPTPVSPSSVMLPPQTPKKYGGKKTIATIFAIALLLVGSVSTIILVQRQALITGLAWDCSKYVFEVSRDGTVTARNGSSQNEPSQNADVFVNDVKVQTLNVPALNAGQAVTLGTVTVPAAPQGFTWKVDGQADCDDNGSYSTTASVTPTTSQNQPASCPAGTELLFAQTGSLPVGKSVGGGGTVSSVTDTWTAELQDGQVMAAHGKKITVTFPQNVLLDTVLIYDNDHDPWTINGQALPGTQNEKWGPPYKLNKVSNQMVFDNTGDSPHFNVCIKPEATASNTPSPTKTITHTPTPTNTLSASCSDVRAYDANWNLLNTSQLASLKTGDIVRFAVEGTASSGTFDKARFTVNGQLRSEVSTKKPSSNEFYDEYTIPAGTVNFTVSAQVHHVTLGWL